MKERRVSIRVIFLYFEETDLCKRAKAFGYLSCYVPESRVMHILGQSTGVTEIADKPTGYWFELCVNYYIKNHGVAKAAMVDLATIAAILGGSAKRFVKCIVGKKSEYGTPNLIQGLLEHSPLLGKVNSAKPFKSQLLED